MSSGGGQVRRRVIAVATALAPILIVAGTPPSARAVTSEQAVAFLNQQRAANGIPGDLANDTAWADGCAKHNLYSSKTGDWGHSEDSNSPYYTPEGATAAGSAVIATGGGYTSSGKNPWEWAPIHLYAMLAPTNARAGYDAGHGYVCMRVYGEERPAPAAPQLFSYPGPGTTGIYPAETAYEWPYTPQQLVGIPEGQATGTNILLFSAGTRGLEAESFSLRGPDGAVPARMVDETTENEIGNGSWFRGGGVIVPERPLAEHATYTVSVKWRNRGYQSAPEYQPEEAVEEIPFLSQEFNFTTGSMPKELLPEPPMRHPTLRLRQAGSRGGLLRLRLTAAGVLRGHEARLVAYRQERGCGRLFASAAGSCGWRQLSPPKRKSFRLEGVQFLRVREPARWQKVSVKVRVRGFRNGEVPYASVQAKLTIKR
jgi:hypothetical protein